MRRGAKAKAWRRFWRAVRYDRREYEVTGGRHPYPRGFRTRAVDRMFRVYPDWPFNPNGKVRGWRL